MTATAFPHYLDGRKDWRGAFAALRRLLADANDTNQVFKIMRALNAGTARTGYDRLLRTAEGGRMAYQRTELSALLSDPAFVRRFPEGSLGAAYGAFLDRTGYSAEGLAMISRESDPDRDAPHPYAWFARRTRDVHDIWHILTGYRADEPLGEACLTAFSYAQTGGLGWALIAAGGAVRGLRAGSLQAVKAIWEGYRNGRRAAWLLGEDYERLFAEPLEGVRARLNIAPAEAYRAMDRIS
ncbi:MAG: Coq4 family protein [Sphingomonadales bacterium]